MINKKQFIIISSLAILFFIIVIVLYYALFSKKENANDAVEYHQGTLTIDESSETPATDNFYEADADFKLEPAEYGVYITNLDCVYDILTLDTIGRIDGEIAEFINAHGYGDVHEVTILEDTIVYDKFYPYFVCTLNGTDKCIEIRYALETATFEFKIMN